MLETIVLLYIFGGILWLIKLKKNSIYLKKNCVTIYNTIQTFWSVIFYFKEINTFIQDGCVTWIHVIVKTYVFRKYLYFEQMLFFVFIKEKNITGSKKQYEAAQQFQQS